MFCDPWQRQKLGKCPSQINHTLDMKQASCEDDYVSWKEQLADWCPFFYLQFCPLILNPLSSWSALKYVLFFLNSEHRKAVPHVGRMFWKICTSSKYLGTRSCFTYYWSLTLSFHESAMPLPGSQQAIYPEGIGNGNYASGYFACTSITPCPKRVCNHHTWGI